MTNRFFGNCGLGRHLSIAVSALAFLGACGPSSAPSDSRLLITNVNIVSMDDEMVLENHHLLIEDGRIAAIGPGTIEDFGGAVADGAGRYLVPGLINSHIHIRNREDFDQYLSFGVTTVRDMIGDERHLKWRDAIRNGVIRGPEVLVASPLIYDGQDPSPEDQYVRGPEHGREVVRAFAAAGFDLVKVTRIKDYATLKAVADEAAQQGMRLAGHAPSPDLTIEELAGSGMASVEHLREITSFFLSKMEPQDKLTAFGALAASGLAITPMLVPEVERNRILAQGDEYLSAERRSKIFRYWGYTGITRINRFLDWARNLAPADRDRSRFDIESTLKSLGMMHRAGLKLLIGTEGKNFDWQAGEGLHREMELFQRAGLSNYEVLRSATVVAAEVLGIQDRKGIIAVGKSADFILVDENPLQNLSTLREPRALVLRGTYIDPDALEAIRNSS